MSQKINFSEINLTPTEENILLKMNALGFYTVDSIYADPLFDAGLILKKRNNNSESLIAPNLTDVCYITSEGRRYAKHIQRLRKSKLWENTRYWITTAIAILALIIALYK